MKASWNLSRLRSQKHPVPRASAAPKYRFDSQPWLVYWEITRACGLACRHCRAEAVPHRHPLELSTDEGERLIDSVRRFGVPAPHLIITGGDPLRRPDLFHLISYAKHRGVGVSLAPSVTELLTRDAIHRLSELQVNTISLSLDGANDTLHDAIRGIPGCFDRTLAAARAVVEEGIHLQVNTLVAAETVAELKRIDRLVETLGAMRWSLFFLVGVGRGSVLQGIGPQEAERLMAWIAERMRTAPFQTKTTEAPHFRRVLIQRCLAEGLAMSDVQRLPFARGFGIRDGKGIVFVSHVGEVYPSGFLPFSIGNVRATDLDEIYRHTPLLSQLRDPDNYEGKCGRCEFRYICGGSRARAYVETGNVLGSDPLCPYEPGTGRVRHVTVAG